MQPHDLVDSRQWTAVFTRLIEMLSPPTEDIHHIETADSMRYVLSSGGGRKEESDSEFPLALLLIVIC